MAATLASSQAPGLGETLLVACSGGADSVALLGLLRLLARKRRWSLALAHVHHGLREESDAEAQHVEEIGRALGFPVVVTRLALAPGSGLPARARVARRQALQATAAEVGASWIALGHTSTDQTETVLMHLTRGAGLDGLAAMPVSEQPWIRPLLGISRAKTRELCGLLGFTFVDDPTNLDTQHLRVRIREQVLPVLRAQNPKLEDAVFGLSQVVGDANTAIAQWATKEMQQRQQADCQSWRIQGFAELPRAVRACFVRQVCQLAGAEPGACGRAVVAEIERAITVVERTRGSSAAELKPRRWAISASIRLVLDVLCLRVET